MKYDDASWHYDGDFPQSSPEEYGATHIALLMKWCFLRGFVGEIHLEDEESKTALKNVMVGKLGATEFFMDYCDGKLTDQDFDEDGNQFLQYYYGESNLYLSDYADVFGEQMYVAAEEDHDFAKFSKMVEKRYRKFIGGNKPWWKLW